MKCESCLESHVGKLDDLIIIFFHLFFILFFFFCFLFGGNADPHQTAVASLAPNTGVLGSTPEEAALIDQWIHLAESEVDSFNSFIRGITGGRIAYSKPVRHSSSSSKRNHLLPDTFFRYTLPYLSV